MSRQTRLYLGAAILVMAALVLFGGIGATLMAIWGGDGRWGDTAFLLYVIAVVGAIAGGLTLSES